MTLRCSFFLKKIPTVVRSTSTPHHTDIGRAPMTAAGRSLYNKVVNHAPSSRHRERDGRGIDDRADRTMNGTARIDPTNDGERRWGQTRSRFVCDDRVRRHLRAHFSRSEREIWGRGMHDSRSFCRDPERQEFISSLRVGCHALHWSYVEYLSALRAPHHIFPMFTRYNYL